MVCSTAFLQRSACRRASLDRTRTADLFKWPSLSASDHWLVDPLMHPPRVRPLDREPYREYLLSWGGRGERKWILENASSEFCALKQSVLNLLPLILDSLLTHKSMGRINPGCHPPSYTVWFQTNALTLVSPLTMGSLLHLCSTVSNMLWTDGAMFFSHSLTIVRDFEAGKDTEKYWAERNHTRTHTHTHLSDEAKEFLFL